MRSRLVSNIPVGDSSPAAQPTATLDPVGIFIALNGVILLAYVIAVPANEIAIPTILMLTVPIAGLAGVGEQRAGVMFEAENTNVTRLTLETGGWTLLTAVNLMLFSLIHNPCSTTIYTIRKETRSAKWTLLSALLPLVLGLVACAAAAKAWRLLVVP